MDFKEYFNPELIGAFSRVLALIFLALPAVFWLSHWVNRRLSDRFSSHQGMLASKAILYAGVVMILLTLIRELGFSISHILGAAGVAGVAIGFAAQTSLSNFISGLFLMAEKPFVVGDIIVVGETTGAVLSIDTLSVKLRTFDNQMVRIPNETIIKTETTTATRFPIRRVDLEVGIAYKEDIARVRGLLLEVAHQNPLVLEDPEPLVHMVGYGSSSVDLKFVVWCVCEDWINVKNQMYEQVKKRFDDGGVEIPFPHLSLYKGEATAPIPIQLIEPEPKPRKRAAKSPAKSKGKA
ncbi:MAG: small-conductance mechanosensitive channel [Limisphaerales bacterium]|jgi:small-conductance mechanosensitive channel